MIINIHKYGKGYPLVFFHGWGFDSQVWKPLVVHLSKCYQLILVDLPGFGATPMMNWNSFKENLIQQLPIRFVLVGWSLGGLYAQRLAIECSDKVDYLIGIGSSPKFLMDHLWPGINIEVFQRFHQKLSTNFLSTIQEFLKLNGLKNNQYLPNKNPPSVSLELGLKILETWDLRDQLKQFVKKTCFMFGRLDPIVPIKTMKVMENIYPHFQYVLFDRAGHIPFLSHSELFIKKIKELIQ